MNVLHFHVYLHHHASNNFSLCFVFRIQNVKYIANCFNLKLKTIFTHLFDNSAIIAKFFAWDEDEMKYLKSIIASLAPFSVLEINASLAPVQWCLKSICFSCSCSIVLEINNVSIGKLRTLRLEPHKTVPKNLLLSFTHVLCNGYVGC